MLSRMLLRGEKILRGDLPLCCRGSSGNNGNLVDWRGLCLFRGDQRMSYLVIGDNLLFFGRNHRAFSLIPAAAIQRIPDRIRASATNHILKSTAATPIQGPRTTTRLKNARTQNITSCRRHPPDLEPLAEEAVLIGGGGGGGP